MHPLCEIPSTPFTFNGLSFHFLRNYLDTTQTHWGRSIVYCKMKEAGYRKTEKPTGQQKLMREKEAPPNLPAFIYFTLISSSYSERQKLDRKALSTAAFLLL